MSTTARLSSEERRAAIVRAVQHVFAEKGFHGTTTRALAEAAGVSEALLFKHFPNKEALYLAIQESCCNEQQLGTYERIQALDPSAHTLVLLIHFLVSVIIDCDPERENEQAIKNRLMLRSLAQDGEFARLLVQRLRDDWIPKVNECLSAAIDAGEALQGPVLPDVAGWLVYNVAAMARFCALPTTPVVDYGIARKQLVEQVVWFSLRGLGLKEQAIRRYYNPKALALFTASS